MLPKIWSSAKAASVTALEKASEALEHDDNVLRVQQALARLATFGMTLGFRSDPGAALLFEFAQWAEREHGRDAVVSLILKHNAILDGSLVHLLEAVLIPRLGPVSEETLRQAERVRHHLLSMLCEMAALEDPRPLPPLATTAGLRAYFEEAILPHEFHLLGALAAGDPAAFATLHPPKKTGRLDRWLTSKRATQQGHGELQTRAMFAHDPALLFLSTSTLFFLQTYTTCVLVETLPELLHRIRNLAQKVAPGPEGPDATDPPEPVAAPVIDLV